MACRCRNCKVLVDCGQKLCDICEEMEYDAQNPVSGDDEE
jgi:RNA polymerase subunit RPABC4/transcription elongation factor Spt4